MSFIFFLDHTITDSFQVHLLFLFLLLELLLLFEPIGHIFFVLFEESSDGLLFLLQFLLGFFELHFDSIQLLLFDLLHLGLAVFRGLSLLLLKFLLLYLHLRLKAFLFHLKPKIVLEFFRGPFLI